MANAVSNVVAGKPLVSGGVLVAPTGTALPADNAATLNASFLATGYIGDAGLVETPARTTNTSKAWGGDIIKVLQTDFTLTYQFTFVETLKANVAQTIYGSSNVTVTAPDATHGNRLAVKYVSTPLPHLSWVFDMADGIALTRIVIPDGQIIDVGAITYSDADVVAYQVTLQAFYNSTLGGVAAKYTDDGLHS